MLLSIDPPQLPLALRRQKFHSSTDSVINLVGSFKCRPHVLLAGHLGQGMLCRAGWTDRVTLNGLFSPPAAHAIQHMLCILLLVLCTAPATAEEPLCDLSPFIEQTPEGVAPCKTCFFPTYPGINSLDLAKYPAQDFTNQWIYFSGDSTLRQVYGEFYGIIHRTQVCACSLLLYCSTL